MDLDPRLLEVVASVFGPEAQIQSADDGPDNIEGWDSVGHLNLILAVEAEFDLQFETSEIGELLTIGRIQERILAS